MKSVKNAFVQSTQIKNILDIIDSKRGSGHRRCPEHMAVIGESGSGKTTLIEYLRKKYSRYYSENDECDIVPIVTASFPKDVSTLYMVRHMLKALGDPDYRERDLDSAYERLWYLLEKCKVEFICFDEFHNIRKGDARTVSSAAEKFIKDLSNNCKAVQIVFGTREAEDLIETVDELVTRFDEILYMPTYSAKRKEKAELVAYLQGLSAYADINNPEFLYEESMVYRICIATNALPRTMGRLIDRAISNAKLDGRIELKLADFHVASQSFKSTKRQAKVFTLKDAQLNEFLAESGFEKLERDRVLEHLYKYSGRKRPLVSV